MINLKKYKNYLINKYDSEEDNLPDKRLKRKENLESKYTDEDLERIIFDTYSFARDVLDSDSIKEGYCKIPVDEDNTKKILLGLDRALSSDTLFYDNKGRAISGYIARQFFGDYFYIELLSEEYEKDEGFYYKHFIYMQGFPKDIDELKLEVNEILDNKEIDKSKQKVLTK